MSTKNTVLSSLDRIRQLVDVVDVEKTINSSYEIESLPQGWEKREGKTHIGVKMGNRCQQRQHVNMTRLQNPSFAADVRACLTSLGLTPDRGNFRLYDSIIDWRVFASGIGTKIFRAKCHIIDNSGLSLSRGRPVKSGGILVVVDQEIAAQDRSAATEKLRKHGFEVISWI